MIAGKVVVLDDLYELYQKELKLCIYCVKRKKQLSLDVFVAWLERTQTHWELQSAPCVTVGEGEGSREGVTHSSKSNC